MEIYRDYRGMSRKKTNYSALRVYNEISPCDVKTNVMFILFLEKIIEIYPNSFLETDSWTGL